jgi:hypothetical protein
MTDKQWHKSILKAHKLAIAHREAMQVAEEEYERRYGYKPSEWDDDWWIDIVHYGMGGDTSLDRIKQEAQRRKDR